LSWLPCGKAPSASPVTVEAAGVVGWHADPVILR
jgi:hypothetical protein